VKSMRGRSLFIFFFEKIANKNIIFTLEVKRDRGGQYCAEGKYYSCSAGKKNEEKVKTFSQCFLLVYLRHAQIKTPVFSKFKELASSRTLIWLWI